MTRLLPLALILFALAPANASAATCKLARLPDKGCSPGVAKMTDTQTLCQTTTSSPAISRTLQAKTYVRYGIPRSKRSRYYVDRVIPSSLAGTTVLSNLFPQSLANFRKKNRLEAELRASVCRGEIALSDAQRTIAENWVDAYNRFFG